MRFFYGIGMYALYTVMWIASRFNRKAHKWIEGRRTGLPLIPSLTGKQVAWFHCASLGEFDQGLPVMNAYKEQFPGAFLLVTFFSPSGMDHYAKRAHKADLVMYLPLDTRKNAKRFIGHFKPQHVFFVKYEFWYNHLREAKRSGATIFGVSSLFRPSHRFFKWYGGFFRKALHLFDHFFVQDKRSEILLAAIGIDQVSISGDTRYDRMLAVKANFTSNERIERFKDGKQLIILGSSWPVDETLFSNCLAELTREYKLLVAPHDISEEHLLSIEQKLGPNTVRYSNYVDQDVAVMVLDTIGQLTAAYFYGDLAYVGGGYSGKLHNILEPGAFGLPVIFGPKHERFPEAGLFVERGVAVSLQREADLLPAIEALMCRRKTIALELDTIFQENGGAARKIIDFVSKTV